ncbi:Uncharacterised protein [Cedecea neteri]|uniref:Uncharacterized protein n=1 Tax=Cedecea neteri TaxID=158822 RepID=A0A2X3IML9_9ENTR|nr:Uncharacterised protein [Cedecea neteri]
MSHSDLLNHLADIIPGTALAEAREIREGRHSPRPGQL